MEVDRLGGTADRAECWVVWGVDAVRGVFITQASEQDSTASRREEEISALSAGDQSGAKTLIIPRAPETRKVYIPPIVSNNTWNPVEIIVVVLSWRSRRFQEEIGYCQQWRMENNGNRTVVLNEILD
ncbi:uncharacterized protein LOC135168128 [Diachasmimorpha longicaudata]|uniref:uncharacterized protein LOC135168128 n=1 Tax=Diachasmimorpha longicaudata TaxID=58733 RepID=UPI0030B91BC4